VSAPWRGPMSSGVIAAARTFFSAGSNYRGVCGRIRARTPFAAPPARASVRPPPGRRCNTLKIIVNPAEGAGSTATVRFFCNTAFLACVLHFVRGGGPNGLKYQFRAMATACRAVVLTEDPPFGGLWCDQPAIFLWAESRLAALSASAARDRSTTPAKSVVFAGEK
jgi:hypothetical protein